MKNPKWQLVSDDGHIVFDMNVNLIGQNDKAISTGMVLHRGREVAMVRTETENFFKRHRKKKQPETAIAYALAHRIALYMTDGQVKKANKLVCDWFGIKYNDSAERSIARARNDYFKPPKGSIFVFHDEPPGLTVLLQPENIKINDGALSYSGLVWSWWVGQHEAYMGLHSFVAGDHTNPTLLIEPPPKNQKKG